MGKRSADHRPASCRRIALRVVQDARWAFSRALLLAIPVTLSALTAGSASALTVTSVGQQRAVSAEVAFQGQSSSDSDSALDFSAFSSTPTSLLGSGSLTEPGSFASASQTSGLTGNTLAANGRLATCIVLVYDDGSARASSLFSWTFEVDEAAVYTLAGSITTHGIVVEPSTFDILNKGTVRGVQLAETGGPVLFGSFLDNDVDTAWAVSDQGVLQPGEYTLTLALETYILPVNLVTSPAGNFAGDEYADYDLSLGLAPVPEPSTGLLLAIGLGVIAMGKRRRKTARR